MERGNSIKAESLERIINSMDDGILLLDRNRTVQLENDSIEKIFASSLIGEKIEDAIKSSMLMSAIDAIFSGEETEDFRIDIYKKWTGEQATIKGKGRELKYNVHLTKTSEDEVCVILRNVTVEERLAMVRQDFISNASHELKTPLTAIAGFSETISEEKLSDDEMKFFAKIIHKNSTHMEHILQDLLLLTSLDRSEIAETMENVDIRRIISEAVSYTVYKAQEKHIDMLVDTESHTVFCNESLIVQALVNLIVNAISYSPEKSKVRIGTAEKNGRLYITVSDDGCGIRKEDQARIFERFYRVDKARSRASGGTGLGLAIVRHIAILHKGTITVESEEGKGARFTLRLPLSVPR